MTTIPPIHISRIRTGIWMLATCCSDPTAADRKNKSFITRWNRIRQSKEVELYGRLHSDMCNVPTDLLPSFWMQIKSTKTKRDFFLMNKDADPKVISKFLDAQLLVKSARSNPANELAHNTTLQAGASQNIT
jgi:hypothetical protein